jgi:hypothetical protein
MRTLIFVLAGLLLAIPCRGRTITVDCSGSADFDNIQAAINDASDGDTVIVYPGLYPENINYCGKNLTLKSTDPNNKSIVESTIIDGNDANAVVTFSGTEGDNCVLAGFTITNGRAHSGGGIIGHGTMAAIMHNIISHNDAVGGDMPGSYGWGGGLLGCDGLIQHNTISNNSAMIGGGLSHCDGTIQHNIVTLNSAGYLGGGLASCGGLIKSNIILLNQAGGHGGGLAYCDATIQNNIVSYNSAPSGVGGGLHTCSAQVENTTIYGNWTLNGGGGLDDCDGSVSNCIVWGNLPDQVRGTPMVRYSAVQGRLPGEGNIDADPCLADPCNGDYHLKSQGGRWDPNSESWVLDDVTSPCIDTGDWNSPIDDEPYPNGGVINMGAYGGTDQASKSPAITCWETAECAGQPLGDSSCDGVTNLADLFDLKGYFGKSAPWTGDQCCADFDHSGTVNLADLYILKWGWKHGPFSPSSGNQNCPP